MQTVFYGGVNMSQKIRSDKPSASDWGKWNSQLSKYGLSQIQREAIIGKNPNSQSREISSNNMLIWQRGLTKGI